MNYHMYCVIAENREYVTCVLAGSGGELRYYTMNQGERLLDAPVPALRVPGSGLLRPAWNGAAWVETATAEEIALWDATHAPVCSGDMSPLADRVETLETETAAISAAIERGLSL